MRTRVLLLVPRLDFSGPIRGAKALYNGFLELGVAVEFIPMYKAVGSHAVFTNASLLEKQSFFRKISQLKLIFRGNNLSSQRPTVIISFCLQADVLAFMAGLSDVTISSVRGNLYKNYIDDYGLKGYFIAWLHYKILSRFRLLTALNLSMKHELEVYSDNVTLIPNFIDEQSIKNNGLKPTGVFKFVFLGKLSKRKAVLETLEMFTTCLQFYSDIELHIVGDGPMMKTIIKMISAHDLEANVKVYGFLNNPLDIVKICDVLVLPSYSEGISRAAMEALFLGKRCIMQNVDGNAELIESDFQGELIQGIGELSKAMKKMLRIGRLPDEQRLPDRFRQAVCTLQYLDLVKAQDE